MKKIVLLLALFLVGSQAFSQEKKWKVVPHKPISAKMKVISVFEKNNYLALLEVESVDSTNDIRLEKGSEVLAKFYFTTKPNNGDPILPGIKRDDVLLVEISGMKNRMTGQMDYQVFKYTVLSNQNSEASKDRRNLSRC